MRVCCLFEGRKESKQSKLLISVFWRLKERVGSTYTVWMAVYLRARRAFASVRWVADGGMVGSAMGILGA